MANGEKWLANALSPAGMFSSLSTLLPSPA
jgi:hypothetical protein